MVLSLPQLQDKLKSGCSRWMELLGGLRIYTHLPWERNVLVDVALYHLKGRNRFVHLLCFHWLINDPRLLHAPAIIHVHVMFVHICSVAE